MKKNTVLDGLFGLCVGDALGVPFEFVSRITLEKNPVTDMAGNGSHNQPAGTWSDDSSLCFCLAESLCHGFDLNDISERFCRWLYEGYWSAHGKIFDVGITTEEAINRLSRGIEPLNAGSCDEYNNGNGSLMRILPLAFYVKDFAVSDRFTFAHQVSCITHGHLRSQMSCGMYIEIAFNLLNGCRPKDAYDSMKKSANTFYSIDAFQSELVHFDRILKRDISSFKRDEIKSTGYVVHTLEAAIWSFLNNSSYEDAVLTAVNLGGDTDTIAAVTGGLAGIYYGYDNIPFTWRDQIARRKDIIDLSERLNRNLEKEY